MAMATAEPRAAAAMVTSPAATPMPHPCTMCVLLTTHVRTTTHGIPTPTVAAQATAMATAPVMAMATQPITQAIPPAVMATKFE